MKPLIQSILANAKPSQPCSTLLTLCSCASNNQPNPLSSAYNLVASATRSQFVASQIAVLATFLPAMLLSGFLFDIRSMPVVLQWITLVLPARYFVTLLQTIFLAGDLWGVILPNAANYVLNAREYKEQLRLIG